MPFFACALTPTRGEVIGSAWGMNPWLEVSMDTACLIGLLNERIAAGVAAHGDENRALEEAAGEAEAARLSIYWGHEDRTYSGNPTLIMARDMMLNAGSDDLRAAICSTLLSFELSIHDKLNACLV